MAFELPDLPYAHDALADLGMSKETLEYHHDIHHKAYVDNGNKAIAGTEWEGKSVEEIIKGTYDPKAVAQNGIFNNAYIVAKDESEASRQWLVDFNTSFTAYYEGVAPAGRTAQYVGGFVTPDYPCGISNRAVFALE